MRSPWRSGAKRRGSLRTVNPSQEVGRMDGSAVATGGTAPTVARRFREAVEQHDVTAATELLAEDIVFHSPVTFHPFLGRETVTRLLGIVAETFEDFRYTDELEMDGGHALIFRANVAGRELE